MDAAAREETERNRRLWEAKPVLRRIYRGFHEAIAARLAPASLGAVVELGSGIGNIREVIPGCLRTDRFAAPGLDRVEDAYSLSFADGSVSNLILFDVFHHLRHPGDALAEFARVLAPGGRVVVFEPCVSLLGRLVYGAMHPEPLALGAPIVWQSEPGAAPGASPGAAYYAAQGNAWRVFVRGECAAGLAGWRVTEVTRMSAISYVASGGYSGPQLFPDAALGLMRMLDRACDRMPALFATRLLVVLEKPRDAASPASPV